MIAPWRRMRRRWRCAARPTQAGHVGIGTGEHGLSSRIRQGDHCARPRRCFAEVLAVHREFGSQEGMASRPGRPGRCLPRAVEARCRPRGCGAQAESPAYGVDRRGAPAGSGAIATNGRALCPPRAPRPAPAPFEAVWAVGRDNAAGVRQLPRRARRETRPGCIYLGLSLVGRINPCGSFFAPAGAKNDPQ